jgi:AraC-like DNA-binding protein
MRYSEIAPAKHLAKYVKCYWVLEQSTAPERSAAGESCAPEAVVPDGSIEIIFNLSDPFRRYHSGGRIETQPLSIVAGQMREHALIEPSGKVKLFGIRFQAAGAYPFFRFSLSELTGRIESLASVWGGGANELEEKINEALSPEECTAIVEGELGKLLSANRKFDGIVESASEMITSHRGLVATRDVSRILSVSARRLERRFQHRFGLTPKFFSRIVRFQNLLGALREERKEGLLGTALSFGYYDQAHLIHEFKEFSGKSPAAFFADEYQFSQFFLSA